MKKCVLLNAPLSALIAEMGHTDTLVVADAGLPIPKEVERIDLAVSPGLPPFLEVVKAVLSELKVQEAIIADEVESRNPQVYREILNLFGEIPIRRLPHETFKIETRSARAIVRTGEFSPYANVILVSGVVF